MMEIRIATLDSPVGPLALAWRERVGSTANETAAATRPSGNWISVVAKRMVEIALSGSREARLRSSTIPATEKPIPMATGAYSLRMRRTPGWRRSTIGT